MRITVGDFAASRAARTLGICDNETEVLSYLNEGIPNLVQDGEWWGTSQLVQVCVTDGCLTFPREVARVDFVAINGTNVPVQHWATEWLDDWHGYLNERCSDSRRWTRVVDRSVKSNVCTFADIAGSNKRVRIYIDNPADAGKVVTLQGYDKNPVWIITESGTVQGVNLTLVAPEVGDGYVETAIDISALTGVFKPITLGPIRLYEHDTETDSLRALAVYQPTEINPSYRRFFIDALKSASCRSCTCSTSDPASATIKTVQAIVKLEHVTLTEAADRLLISDMSALKHQCLAIRYGEMDSVESKQLSKVEHAEAIRLLNKQLRHYTGRDAVAIKVRPFGSAHLSKKRIGSIM